MIDLVISGPDMSGTGTQVRDIIRYFQSLGKKVRDIRGTEICALFHAEKFRRFNQKHIHLNDLLNDDSIPDQEKQQFLLQAHQLLAGGSTNEDLRVASCVNNEVSVYIDPDSADVWVLEEPTKRGAGQVNRVIEQQRTKYGSSLDPVAAAYAHQAYRVDEFLRFRKALRERGKIIIRSRSEESACYQISDPEFLPQGISREIYLNLPGHQIAFGNPPTHIFIVCAPADWSKEKYLDLKRERSEGRSIDDHESSVDYQLLVNRRYATNWLEELYQEGCSLHGGKRPQITRFNIYNGKEEVREKMINELRKLTPLLPH